MSNRLETERFGSRRRQRPVAVWPAIHEAWRERELLLSLLQRDLRVRYRRTALGWFWSMLNPAATTVVYSVVFSYFLGVRPQAGDPSGITTYAFYLLAGSLAWNLLVNGVMQGMSALIGGSSLISKVKFSKEHLVISTVLSLTVTLLLELVVLCFLQLTIGKFPILYLPMALLVVVLLAIFTTGVALWAAALNFRYRDVQHILTIGFMVWFFLTPIVYPRERIPTHWVVRGRHLPMRSIMELNPMNRFVMVFRNFFFDHRLPGFNTMIGLLAISALTFMAGYRYFVRRAPWFAEEL
jgi:ABC-type polysaccharide/polyol phosphate export permease